jgi:hypothetical protein
MRSSQRVFIEGELLRTSYLFTNATCMTVTFMRSCEAHGLPDDSAGVLYWMLPDSVSPPDLSGSLSRLLAST